MRRPFFLASLLFHLLMGFLYPGSGQVPEIRGIFASVFVSSWITVIPALIVVGLVLFRVNVRLTMGISVAAASLICFFIQHMGISDILSMLVLGYQSENATVAHLMNGGGMVSFAKGIAIVCISATYAGIFIRTRLLQGIRGMIERVAARVSIVSAVTLAAILACGVSCNQSFAAMLTHDLCTGVRPDQEKLALDIEEQRDCDRASDSLVNRGRYPALSSRRGSRVARFRVFPLFAPRKPPCTGSGSSWEHRTECGVMLSGVFNLGLLKRPVKRLTDRSGFFF